MFYYFFINIVFTFVLCTYWIHYIVIYFFSDYFGQYKEYIIFLILFSNFSNTLLAFIGVRATGNFWRVYLGVNILSHSPFLDFIANIPLLEALRVNSRPS